MINDSILIVLISIFTALLGEGMLPYFCETMKLIASDCRVDVAAGLPDGQVSAIEKRSRETVQEM
jgi:hypothetical protein